MQIKCTDPCKERVLGMDIVGDKRKLDDSCNFEKRQDFRKA